MSNRLIILLPPAKSVFNIRIAEIVRSLCSSLPLACFSSDVFIFSCRRRWLHSPLTPLLSLLLMLLSCLALLVVVYVLMALSELPDNVDDDVNCDAGSYVGVVSSFAWTRGIFE